MPTILILDILKKENCDIEIYTDSQYVKKGITEWLFGWKRNNWKNSKKQELSNFQKDIESLVTLYVKNGKVTIRKPIPKEKLDKEMNPTRLIMSLDVNKENALSLTEIQTFANKIYA